MEINTAQLQLSKKLDKDFASSSNNETQVKSELSSQSDISESSNIKVSLSSQALSLLDSDKIQNNKSNEQKTIDYRLAKKQYQKEVNELPVDYRKMKVAKDMIDEEIKALKAEVSKLKQSKVLDKEELEEQISLLEQQIAVKSLAVIEIGKEFTQRVKEQERSKQISSENAAEMLNIFNSSPPKAPIENKQ